MLVYREARVGAVVAVQFLLVRRGDTLGLPLDAPCDAEDEGGGVARCPPTEVGRATHLPHGLRGGVFVFDAELEPVGGFDALRPRAVVYGYPIAPDVAAEVRRARSTRPWWPPADAVAIVYHGTTAAAAASIVSSGFLPTHGMLGRGVYMGTFWKAVRFAARDAAYALRRTADTGVLRCALPRSFRWKVASVTDVCACAACAAAARRPLLADHDSSWARSGYDGLWLDPSATLGSKGIAVRNAEGVVGDPAALVCVDWGQIDVSTEATARYEPLRRTARLATH